MVVGETHHFRKPLYDSKQLGQRSFARYDVFRSWVHYVDMRHACVILMSRDCGSRPKQDNLIVEQPWVSHVAMSCFNGRGGHTHEDKFHPLRN